MIEVLRPGALTTVQDLGRPGFRDQGVPRGGVFDSWAARAANRRAGNPDGAAVLEVTLLGPHLRFEKPAVIAIAGDAFEAYIDDAEIPIEKRRPVKGGQVLRLERARGGVRCWIALGGGGFDAPEILGSRSTDLAGRFGGHAAGRRLDRGDRLQPRLFPSVDLFSSSVSSVPSTSTSSLTSSSSSLNSSSSASSLPSFSSVPEKLRVLRGPEAGAAFEALVAAPWRVLADSDRRGVRLGGGARIAEGGSGERRTSGVLPGTVQLPPSGEPIVLGVDAPVTGGYPWIAQVIEADVAGLAHLAPGAPVRFVAVDFDIAERALAERWRELEARVGGAR
jgi:biotin-dependent carboxylase-like uncharacterized protein